MKLKKELKVTKEMYRQGDLLFIKTDKLTGQEKSNRHVLESSVTGHSHTILDGKVFVNDLPNWEFPGNFYIQVPDTELIHQEHKTIKLSAGIYEVRRQREVNGYVRD